MDKEEIATEGEHAEEAGNAVAAAPTRMTFRNIMAICALSGLLAGSQIPVYLVGGGIANVYMDIGGENSYAWLSIANTLALAAIAPFAGSFADLVGRRWVAMIGGILIIVGCAVLGTAHTMPVAIGGMAIAGAGAGLGELTATAAVVELVPVQKRGYYVSLVSMRLLKSKTHFLKMFLFILPFCPAAMYAQLFGAYSTWRWAAWITLGYNLVVLIMIFIFYHPPPRRNSSGLTKMEIIKRIDILGGVLSIGGFALFLLGIQWGMFWCVCV